ncbi:MAG: hypothetical protein KatS3mg115_1622 [Candidatus Poribacteria bacterium]|nr:MAG: hypothetical protein KatS3mg115_1622 [Candidatus Poribacteria bacterium]
MLLLVSSFGSSPDERIFLHVQEHWRRPALDTVFQTVNHFGDSRWVLLGSLAMIGGGTALDRPAIREDGTLLLAGFVAAGGAVYTIKRLVDRPRPLDPEDRTSMVSGHATFAALTATVLGGRHPRWRVPLSVLAGATALARVYLGRHYPSDVIAGVVLGYAVGRLVLWQSPTILSIRF